MFGSKAKSGVYGLDKADDTTGNTSFITIFRAMFPADPKEVKEMIDFMRTAKDANGRGAQDTFMKYRVPRLQMTLASQQYSKFMCIKDHMLWPDLAKAVITNTQELAKKDGDEYWEEYNGVHLNAYQCGTDSVSKHADDEDSLIPGAAIYSYTLYSNIAPGAERNFCIFRNKDAMHVEGKGKVACITTYHGDVIKMHGKMQEYFKHSIEKEEGKNGAMRLNLTVRRWKKVLKRKAEEIV